MKAYYALFAVALLFGSGYAIQCYQCSDSDHGCGDGAVDKAHLKNCPGSTLGFGLLEYVSCKKSSGSFLGVTSTTVTRECSSVNDVGCSDFNIAGVSSTVCYCKTDACNSSVKILPSLMALLMMSIMSVWCFA